VARLVEQQLHAAGKHHRHCDPEAEVLGLAAELDALAFEVGLVACTSSQIRLSSCVVGPSDG
jgi:hypothetical protein